MTNDNITRAPWGAETAPLSTFRNISQSVAAGATKLSVPLPTSILHKLTKGCCKGYDRSAENDVRVMSCSAILDLKKGLREEEPRLQFQS